MKYFFAFALLLLTHLAFAQADFVVYYAKGTALKASTKTKLLKGTLLSSRDIVELGDASELILICSNYQTLRLKQKGRHRLQQWLAHCSKKTPSFTETYFRYVWNELLHKHGSVEDNPTAYMRNSGAVSRGCPFIETAVSLDTIIHYSGKLPLRITSSFGNTQLQFFASAGGGEPDLAVDVDPSNPVPIDSAFALLQKNRNEYYWRFAEENGMACGTNILYLLDKNTYEKKVRKVLSTVVSTTPAETAFLKGYLLEENFLLAEAVKYYRRAFELEPKNDVYKNAWNRFR